jgi:heat shock protein HslJ
MGRWTRRSALAYSVAAVVGIAFGRSGSRAHEEATPHTEPAGEGRLIARRWHLTEVAGADGAARSVDDPGRYWMTLGEDGSVFAQLDCNSGRGRYTLAGDLLTIEALATTRMACPDDSLGSQLELALSQESTVALQGDVLWLQGADGSQLTFESVLNGAVWTWVSTTHPGSDAVLSAVTPQTIQLLPNGMVRVQGACNAGFGGFKLEGETLTFTAIAMTMMACEDLEAEDAFLQSLNATRAFTLNGDRLELTLADGGAAVFSSDLVTMPATPAAG